MPLYAALLILLAAGCSGSDSGPTEPGESSDAMLTFDSGLCRNTGQVLDDGLLWDLEDPVPLSWRHESPQQGVLHVLDDANATFTAGDVILTLGAETTDICYGWEGD